MSLIITTPTVQEVITDLKKSNTLGFEFLVNTYKTTFNAVWNNPLYTPQEIFAELGTDGGSLFLIASKTAELIHTIDPDFVLPVPPVPYIIDESGVVTIS